MKKTVKRIFNVLILSVIISFIFAVSTLSSEEFRDKGTVYVPVYSSIFHGDKQNEIKLTVTISIRNTDMSNSISITSVDYYDSAGKFLLPYIKQPMQLKPLATVSFLINESENKGGAGAKFIVKWRSNSTVSKPLIETVMIGTRGQQGISFSSRGKEISE